MPCPSLKVESKEGCDATVKILGTLVDILAQMHLGNYNFSLLSATSLCDHP